MNKHKQTLIDTVKAAGFKVFVKPGDVTWLYFTDADEKRIGYLQWDRSGYAEISSVHKPNKNSGTGFKLDPIPRLDRENLEKAFTHAPSWASSRDRDSVIKSRFTAFGRREVQAILEQVGAS